MVISLDFVSGILDVYAEFLGSLPDSVAIFINLFLIVLLVVIYSIFVWKFYRFISLKNIFNLDLNKYNHFQHRFLIKLFAGLFYFLEYLIILPFLIFFWFVVFSFFLILLVETDSTKNILLISAAVIAAIRMTSYYTEDLSKDLAKMIPFTLLGISILNPNFFNLERSIEHFNQIPILFDTILYYLLFIICLEFILRFFDFIFSLFESEETAEIQEAIKNQSDDD